MWHGLVPDKMRDNIVQTNDLKDVIINYDEIVAQMPSGMKSNNKVFNDSLEKLVTELIRK